MTKLVQFNFPEKLIEKLDRIWKKKGYQNRTAFVLEAVRNKLEKEASS